MAARRPWRALATVMSSLLAAGLVLTSAVAQEAKPAKDDPGLLESVGRWFDEQSQKIGSTFKDAGKNVENFGHEAGVAAKTTVEGAKDAAGAVVRIPAARVVTGHQKCQNAPNGAPDCVAGSPFAPSVSASRATVWSS